MLEFNLSSLIKGLKEPLVIIRLLIGLAVIGVLVNYQFKLKREIPQIEKSTPKDDFARTNIDHLKAFCYDFLPGAHFGYIADTVNIQEGEADLVMQSTWSALAPVVFLANDTTRDTLLCQFYKTGSIDHPLNPLHTQRHHWTVLKDLGQGVWVLTKKK